MFKIDSVAIQKNIIRISGMKLSADTNIMLYCYTYVAKIIVTYCLWTYRHFRNQSNVFRFMFDKMS